MTQVTWANDRGGSGTATGTTGWSVSGIALQSGANVLTVTARDAADNTATDTLTVTYTPADTTTSDGDDHDADEHGDAQRDERRPLIVGGTASDNVGVTQVTWANDRGGSGTATGHDGLVGERHRAAERGERADGDGARCGRQHRDRQLTVTYTPADTTNPGVTITTPTSNRNAQRDGDAVVDRWDGLGQRGRDAGDLGQRPGRQRHGDRDDRLVGERHRACDVERTC